VDSLLSTQLIIPSKKVNNCADEITIMIKYNLPEKLCSKYPILYFNRPFTLVEKRVERKFGGKEYAKKVPK